MAETSITFPDGTKFYVRNISSVQNLVGTTPLVVSIGIGASITAYNFTAASAASAQNIVRQISDAMNGNLTGDIQLTNPGAANTFASITPNTAPNFVAYTGVIAGTGFISLGINFIGLDFGAVLDGNDISVALFSIDSDIQITINLLSVEMDPIETPAVVYSIDGGVSWVDTGLTVAIT